MWCFNKLVITVMISNIRPFIWIIDPDISRKLVRAFGKALNKIKKDSIKKAHPVYILQFWSTLSIKIISNRQVELYFEK